MSRIFLLKEFISSIVITFGDMYMKSIFPELILCTLRDNENKTRRLYVYNNVIVIFFNKKKQVLK